MSGGGISKILNHPWIPTSGSDAINVRGFIYDVDIGALEEASYPRNNGLYRLARSTMRIAVV